MFSDDPADDSDALARLLADNDRLRGIVESLARRCHGQSEALSRRTGRTVEMDKVSFQYRNHRGEIAERRVLPIRLFYGSTAWHPNAQLLMECFDLDKQEIRDFAMSGVLSPMLPLDPVKREEVGKVYPVPTGEEGTASGMGKQ